MPIHPNHRDEDQFNVELPKPLMARLNLYCERNHVKKKLVVQTALVKLLNEMDRKDAARAN